MKEIVRYEISMDGVGLLGYFEDGNFYHIHSDEMSKLEIWIWGILKGHQIEPVVAATEEELDKLEVYLNGHKIPIQIALDKLTLKEIQEGHYSNFTVYDLVNACRFFLSKIPKQEKIKPYWYKNDRGEWCHIAFDKDIVLIDGKEYVKKTEPEPKRCLTPMNGPEGKGWCFNPKPCPLHNKPITCQHNRPIGMCPYCSGISKLPDPNWRRNKMIGNKNPQWKGDEVSYRSLHEWVNNYLPKPDKCEECKINKPYDASNISGEYKRDLKDWRWLCRKCHMISDGRLEKLAQPHIITQRDKLGRIISVEKHGDRYG